MAWKLRQSVEGDRIVTVENVANGSAECWSDSNGNYIPNTIAIKINNVEYILNSVASLGFGFLFITIPNNVFIGADTNIQVYSVCNTSPDYSTSVIKARPVDFQVSNSIITTCESQVVLNTTLKEYVRLFFFGAQGDYFRLTGTLENNTAKTFDISDFEYQPGDSGDITSSGGLFTRPTVSSENASLFSKVLYGNIVLNIKPVSTKYFTIRLGNLELLFTGTVLRYINYLSTDRTEVYLTNYTESSEFRITSTNGSYVVQNVIEGTTLLTITKNITYNVDGGVIIPASTTLGSPVVWNLPLGNGDYTFVVTLAQNIKFSKTVTLHSCGSAVDDYFVGTYNEPFNGNISLNDKLCQGEYTYVEPVSGTFVGMQDFSLDGTGNLTFIPIPNFTGTAGFQYRRFCGKIGTTNYEIVGTANVYIEYTSDCPDRTSNWVDTGMKACIDCIPFKEQRDDNVECSGVTENRWIPIGDDAVCDFIDEWDDTNETKCEYSYKYVKQVNLNRCSPYRERWINKGVDESCCCIAEVFANIGKGTPNFYPVIKLLNSPEEENRAIDKCLIPDLGETCVKNKLLRFFTVNDGLPHTYVITIFDCNKKYISQLVLTDLICATNDDSVQTNNYFNYTLDFTL